MIYSADSFSFTNSQNKDQSVGNYKRIENIFDNSSTSSSYSSS